MLKCFVMRDFKAKLFITNMIIVFKKISESVSNDSLTKLAKSDSWKLFGRKGSEFSLWLGMIIACLKVGRKYEVLVQQLNMEVINIMIFNRRCLVTDEKMWS